MTKEEMILRADLKKLDIKMGAHPLRESGMCVMEAVAWFAGEPHSDRPKCACPVLAHFMREWNDDLPNDKIRNDLLRPLVPLLARSKANPKVEKRRHWEITDWRIRTGVPAFLERVPETRELAHKLSHMAPLLTESLRREAWSVLEDATARLNLINRPVLQANEKRRWSAGHFVAKKAWNESAVHVGLNPVTELEEALGKVETEWAGAWGRQFGRRVEFKPTARWQYYVDKAWPELESTIVDLQHSAVKLIRDLIREPA